MAKKSRFTSMRFNGGPMNGEIRAMDNPPDRYTFSRWEGDGDDYTEWRHAYSRNNSVYNYVGGTVAQS